MRIGEIRARGLRLSQYASLVTAVSSVLIAIKVGAYGWGWVAIGLVCLAILALVDPQVYKGEIQYSNKNNEEWREALEILRGLRK